ncbi:hypothetical protein BJV74DRAFT_831856 [Russula compacta]|nr:hypothetical protein BJV74DRAFT_831856 [Russula compacta]
MIKLKLVSYQCQMVPRCAINSSSIPVRRAVVQLWPTHVVVLQGRCYVLWQVLAAPCIFNDVWVVVW